MNWICKICKFETPRKTDLLKHYRLRHGHGGEFLPCLYWECCCSFKTWGSLRTHLSRNHSTRALVTRSEILSFKCPCCSLNSISTERGYFEHISHHLKKQETVPCVFENCSFKTNIYGTYASHRSRKHSLDVFKPELLQRYVNPLNAGDDPIVEEDTQEAVSDLIDEEIGELPELIEKNLAHLLLKLECIFNVPQMCVNELVEELHFVSSSASGPILKEILQSCIKKHNCDIDDLVISEMVTDLCECNPITLALRSNGPFSTSHKRRVYFKEHFSMVEPIEYLHSAREQRSFQYIPILKSLLEVLKVKEIHDFLTHNCETDGRSETQYKSFRDGTNFKNNELLSENNPAISLILYVDDFEVCNPLGTSRKKHKVTAVYWVLANVPPLLRSSLTSIYLAILCKAEDLKRFGYSAVLQPLLKDLASLEEEGLYIPSLGINVKGTVYCVVADNLGAHSIGGFVESFSSTHVCRFCLGEKSQFQVTKLSTVNLTVLREDLKKALETKLPDAPMSQLPKLRIILQDHDIRKLDLPHGIPGTVAELESIVKETFELNGNFTLHYKDAGFGDEYFSLTSTSELQDKDTIKVIHVVEPPTYTLTFTDLDSTIENETSIHTSDHPSVTSISPNSSCSTGSADTVILSSPEHTTRRSQCWPTEFPIPRFAYDTELVLASRNEAFKKDGIYLVFTSILQDILEKVAETVFQYVAYPTNAQLSDVALALVQKHPSLKEPGSYNGCYGWLQRLKYKMGNYRSKLRGLGCPEVDVNSIRKKRAHDRAPAKNIKKPRRAEVNYLPPHPQGETEGSLENERLNLFDEVNKRDNHQIITEKMAKTFSIRRQEIVNEAPAVSDLIGRWPALFDAAQINEEFKRISTINLEPTFMAKLDQYSPKIMALVSSKGGAAKINIQRIKNMLLEDDSVEMRREVAIRALIVFLKEKEEDLFKEDDGDITNDLMKIVIARSATPSSANIVIEGTEVLAYLNVPRACALLMGLIYSLNLSYPRELRHTFEVFQKIFLELDGLKASPRVMSLKNKLLC
ncbi:uncharacterized protein LOC121709989 isoform X3 [Alosa sapidissima]|uniref:uncharacterized protein LOC121709989 isoform X3 n=1 Tax=Alosa sapidissima TaxID=34773 RepID=UPI001C094804|nr:uncharacterized protein LOC121709989 isoform X3 [Alosa sapidissima]